MVSVTKSIAEGGQTWAHRMRMLRQVIKISVVGSIFIFLTTVGFYLFWYYQPLMLALYYNLKASIVSNFEKNISIDPNLWKIVTNISYGNRDIVLPASKVLRMTNPMVERLYHEFLTSLSLGIKAFFIGNLLLLSYFLFRGVGTKKKKYISGTKISSPWRVKLKLYITGKASKYKIGSLPFLKDSETKHTFITGGTGSGKTNCLHHILSSIRKSGSKTIIIDTTGAFVSKYYRDGRDIILNPFDERGAPWSPWADCQTKFDYEEMAESFIPIAHRESEMYWRNAAKSLFSSLLQKLESTQKISDLVRWSLFEPLKELCSFIDGTKAASHLDINSEKTAGSVRSVASSYLECLENLEDTNNPFSIKNWVKQEEDSWLFICCKPSQRAAIAPLISSWISVAVRGVLNLEPSRTRRIWFVLDEIPTLNKVKGLEMLLTEGRKYGACALLALQSPSQLEAIYGRETAHVIIGNCSTKIVFSEHDPEIAERISKVFGISEIGEYNEGISYGAHEMRDGVSLSYQKKNQATVTPTEIQSLKPNQAYVRLSGKFPVIKLKLGIKI